MSELDHTTRRPRRHRGLLGALLIALVALTACAGSLGPPTSDKDVSRLAPDFHLQLYQGSQVLGAESLRFSEVLAQGKPVVLNLYAGLCPLCRIEMLDIQRTYLDFGGQVLFLGLDVGPFVGLGTNQEGHRLLDELSVTYPAGTVSDPDLVRAYRLVGMPSTYLITPDGLIATQWTGLLNQAKLTELVEKLLQVS